MPPSESALWSDFVNQLVVVDTDSAFLFIGTLKSISDHFVTLVNVDAHDRHETPSTKERYILDAKRFGVKPNRREVNVRKEVIVSLSRLDDILEY